MQRTQDDPEQSMSDSLQVSDFHQLPRHDTQSLSDTDMALSLVPPIQEPAARVSSGESAHIGDTTLLSQRRSIASSDEALTNMVKNNVRDKSLEITKVSIFDPQLKKVNEHPISAISGKRIFIYNGHASRITSSLRANFDCKLNVPS